MLLLYVAVFLTVLSTVPCSSQHSAPTYPWEDAETGEAVTCEKCPPGTYVGSHCSKHERTVCRPCTESQYTEYWNYVEECLLCDYPCSEVQEEVHGCNGTHNRVCRCKEGYYNTLDFCLKHSVCSPGEGVQIAGTRERDVVCAPCEECFFSNVSSSVAACQQHSVCGAHQTAIPGTSTHDTFCSSCKINSLDQQDVKVCSQEAVRFVLARLNPERQSARLLRVLKRASVHNGHSRLLLPELLELLVVQNNTSGLNVLLDGLDRARLHRLRETVSKWFPVQSK
ncbi:tumor necrosis factor receptor superfamily member 6B-like isoform X2 [Alosa sapidissima]|uniref:tumor necrosis factor receptor superfamily member 6B-like isoform X2 n=1 Tax=Alosa sapidissima TaxID=34773 RepID=UPI001C096AF1|nr:tumor necrosis factor receptor superfamily member 6B-like isoform X2 [Alosa sapidissima]